MLAWVQVASDDWWDGVAMNCVGDVQTAVVHGGYIYTSSDYGLSTQLKTKVHSA